MFFRMGINVGDVIAEGDTIYGDGVNIAARLEKLAQPGGVCVGGSVYDQVNAKVAYTFNDLGKQQFHNISKPIHAYYIVPSEPSDKAPVVLSEKPSIAVLPFDNLSGDAEQQYFVDGITEDIITELCRFRTLTVISHHSSFKFRGAIEDVGQIGRTLGARFLLSGSLRRLRNSFRIAAKLIDSSTKHHVWADRFDRPIEEIFNLQDQLVQTIVATLAGRVEAAELELATRKHPSNLAAYDCVLRADALPFNNRKAQMEARRLSEKAIELDPNYARAYAQLAMSLCSEWSRDYTGSDHALNRALSLAKSAVVLDENDSTNHATLGWTYLLCRSYDLSEHHYKKAITLNPNKPNALAGLGFLYGYLGRPDEGLEYHDQVKLIDPYYEPTWYWLARGILHFIAGRYDIAIENIRRSPMMDDAVHGYLAACYALLNQTDSAVLHAIEARRLAPNLTAGAFVSKDPFKHPSDQDRLLNALLKAGLCE